MPVKRTNSETWQKPSPKLRSEPKLEIAAGTFSQEVLLQLVDDWIVPAMVEDFLRSRMNLPELISREHN